MEEFSIKELKGIIEKYNQVVAKFPADIAIVAHNFFLLGLKKGGQFINGTFREWEGRKFNVDRSTKTRKVLTGASNKGAGGTLLDSIKQEHKPLTKNQPGEVRVYTNHPYAEIHNKGGKITITKKMRSYFWAMYYKELERIPMHKRGTQSISVGQRVNQIASIWRNLAMHKGNTITMPARTFLYNSINLNAEIEKLLKLRLKQI